VREECKSNRLRVKAGKRVAKFEDKRDGREECRILTECWWEKKKNTEKKEREKYKVSEKRICQWRSGKIESKRKMNECRAEWKRQRDRQVRKKGKNNRVYERCIQRKFRSTWGQRVQEKEKWWRYLDVGTRREKTSTGWKERKEGAECAMKRERDNWAHVEWM
jgi:hypothetical protein